MQVLGAASRERGSYLAIFKVTQFGVPPPRRPLPPSPRGLLLEGVPSEPVNQ